jgi:hypothetical protein
MADYMTAMPVGWLSTVPPDKYFLGDPCHVLPAGVWLELLLNFDCFASSPIGSSRELQVMAFKTWSKNQTYFDDDGLPYPVESGFIGLVPEALIKNLPKDENFFGLGRLIVLKERTGCTSANGNLQFADVCINTQSIKLKEHS